MLIRDRLSIVFAVLFTAVLAIHITKHPGNTRLASEPKPATLSQEIEAQIPQPAHEACATQKPEVRDQCAEDIREVVRAASEALDNIEEVAPELIALGQQFVKTLESWAGSSTARKH